MIFQKIQPEGFEQLIYCQDSKVGLRAIIALHSLALGPATGGCRMWNYASEEEALYDVLRLSKGMTYKASLAGLKWGGGKSVILGDPKAPKNPQMLQRFGEFVERLGGNYITAKDVGIGAEDLKTIKNKTQYVLGIEGEASSSGDPSPATAWGVYHGMKACVKYAFQANSLKGMTVALQGLGSVSYYLLEHMVADGAKVIGCDIDQSAIDRAVKKYGIEVVSPDKIYDVKCDIFAPSALGASIQSSTIDRINAKVIAGAANNQLATSEDGYELMKRGMIYAPDYAINAGGLINIYYEDARQGGYSKTKAFDHVSKIEQTISLILERSSQEKLPCHVVADRMAEEIVAKAAAEKLSK
jgi:leucine dehydrogenase